MIVTLSDMGKFQNCPRLWWLASYRGLRRIAEPRTGAMPFGSRVHLALQAYYDGRVETPVAAWFELMAQEYAIAEQTGAFTDDLEKEDRLGQAMLEGYLDWMLAEGHDSEYDVVGVEVKLSADLLVDTPDGPVTVLVAGKPDRRLRRRADNSLWIDDFKTTGNFGTGVLDSLVRSPQPRMYMLLEQRQLGGGEKVWTAGAVFTLLRKVLRTKTSNPPYYLRQVVRISAHDLDQYRIRTEAVIESMARATMRLERGEDHRRVVPFHPTWQCGTCPMKLPCHAFQADSEQAAEDMLAELYVAVDPMERYRSEDPDTVLSAI